MLPVTVARSSSDDNAIRYVLPVLWMTSCLRVMGHTARDAGNIDVGAMLQQIVKMYNVFATAATLFDSVVV